MFRAKGSKLGLLTSWCLVSSGMRGYRRPYEVLIFVLAWNWSPFFWSAVVRVSFLSFSSVLHPRCVRQLAKERCVFHQSGSINISLPQPLPRSFSAVSESRTSSPTPAMRSRYLHCHLITSGEAFAIP